MTVEVVPTNDARLKIFVEDLQAAFRRADGTDKFRTEDLLKFFDKTHATLLDILADGEAVGGAVVIVNAQTLRNKLTLLFVNANARNKGIGFAAWQAIEKFFPATKIWETSTLWRSKRNLHFYLNKCRFHAVTIYSTRQPIQSTDEEIYIGLEKIMI